MKVNITGEWQGLSTERCIYTEISTPLAAKNPSLYSSSLMDNFLDCCLLLALLLGGEEGDIVLDTNVYSTVFWNTDSHGTCGQKQTAFEAAVDMT